MPPLKPRRGAPSRKRRAQKLRGSGAAPRNAKADVKAVGPSVQHRNAKQARASRALAPQVASSWSPCEEVKRGIVLAYRALERGDSARKDPPEKFSRLAVCAHVQQWMYLALVRKSTFLINQAMDLMTACHAVYTWTTYSGPITRL